MAWVSHGIELCVMIAAHTLRNAKRIFTFFDDFQRTGDLVSDSISPDLVYGLGNVPSSNFSWANSLRTSSSIPLIGITNNKARVHLGALGSVGTSTSHNVAYVDTLIRNVSIQMDGDWAYGLVFRYRNSSNFWALVTSHHQFSQALYDTQTEFAQNYSSVTSKTGSFIPQGNGSCKTNISSHSHTATQYGSSSFPSVAHSHFVQTGGFVKVGQVCLGTAAASVSHTASGGPYATGNTRTVFSGTVTRNHYWADLVLVQNNSPAVMASARLSTSSAPSLVGMTVEAQGPKSVTTVAGHTLTATDNTELQSATRHGFGYFGNIPGNKGISFGGRNNQSAYGAGVDNFSLEGAL